MRAAIGIIMRVLAAVLGGFMLANAAAALGARLLPLGRDEAVTWSTMLAFPIHLVVILWAFADSLLVRLWGGIVMATAACMAGWALAS